MSARSFDFAPSFCLCSGHVQVAILGLSCSGQPSLKVGSWVSPCGGLCGTRPSACPPQEGGGPLPALHCANLSSRAKWPDAFSSCRSSARRATQSRDPSSIPTLPLGSPNLECGGSPPLLRLHPRQQILIPPLPAVPAQSLRLALLPLLPSSRSLCYPPMYLRVPHPSRLPRRVGPDDPTPPTLFSSFLGPTLQRLQRRRRATT